MRTYMETKEVKLPEEVAARLEELAQAGDPNNPPTLGEAGFFDWLNDLSKNEGWRAVWSCFNFPFLVLEREVPVEEVEK